MYHVHTADSAARLSLARCAPAVRSRIKAFMHTILTIHGDGLELATMSGHGDEAA